ncbi:hypothetical protein I317_07338 [Kwoniella heveanensis CBS 569]|nr:hypothetical protein I317_07338 [Kwoniella heveanensis CBS 569]
MVRVQTRGGAIQKQKATTTYVKTRTSTKSKSKAPRSTSGAKVKVNARGTAKGKSGATPLNSSKKRSTNASGTAKSTITIITAKSLKPQIVKTKTKSNSCGRNALGGARVSGDVRAKQKAQTLHKEVGVPAQATHSQAVDGSRVHVNQNQRKTVKTYVSKTKARAKAVVSTRRTIKTSIIGTGSAKKPSTARAVSQPARKSISKEKEKERSVQGKKATKSRTGDKHVIAANSKKNIVAAGSKARVVKSGTAGKQSTTTGRSVKQSLKVSAPQSSTSDDSIPSTVVGLDKAATSAKVKVPKKEYMTAGFYCQDPHPSATRQLVNQILRVRATESRAAKSAKQAPIASSFSASRSAPARATRGKGRSGDTTTSIKKGKIPTAVPVIAERPSFPPLPYDHGFDLFFRQQHDFDLPWNIRFEAENGLLVRKAKPAAFQKLRGNVYPERPRVSAGSTAVCRCTPESGCGDNCINRIMSYLCGKECPAGEICTNKTLAKRKGPGYKVVHTGARGFGVVLTEDVSEGQFVIDYRGEIISMETFMDRINDEYKGTKNFYALEYDQDEVIDAGMRGNDARFINHGCAPNLEVRKYQTLGDGWEEYEVGMWASRDIKAGEELFYDYNFESFDVAAQSDELRTKCCCGAPNCIGYLGRKAGEKSAKELAAEQAAQSKAAKKSGKKVKKRKTQSMGAPASEANGQLSTAVLGLEATPSDTSASTAVPSPELRTPSEVSEKALHGLEPVIVVLEEAIAPAALQLAPSSKRKRKNEAALVGTELLREPKKKGRNSEPAPSSQVFVIAKSSASPIASNTLAKAPSATRISREEKVKARNGAPKGWAYLLPGAEQAVKLPAIATRRPPRDRSSLG